jgi:hypothetical protein
MQFFFLYVDHRHAGIRNMQTLPKIVNPKIVNVVKSRAAISSTGRVGLEFHTKEVGAILVPINLSAIHSLQAALTEIEQYLIHSNPKKAH